MSSRASTTWPSSTITSSLPSPSTRASAGTVTERLRRLPCVMGLGLLAESICACVEGAEHPGQVRVVHAELLPPGGQRRGVRGLHRAEAAVTAAAVRRAQRAAAGLGYRPEAGRAVGDHHARDPGPLALDAHAVAADIGSAPVQERGDHIK